MEADAPVDEVDALATRIEHIDELGAGDDATYGNDHWGLGCVLKQLIKSADVEGVRKHLELIDYHDEAVSAHHLGLAARLQYAVQYEDVNRHKEAREVLLLLVAASDEQLAENAGGGVRASVHGVFAEARQQEKASKRQQRSHSVR